MKKAADLRIPFVWAERYPVLLEKCLYIPSFYTRHEEWTILPWETIFIKKAPIHLEYCSGNGQWIAERAKRHPEINWVAIEKRFDRARKIWGRIQREELDNLFVVCGEGEIFTRYYVPPDSVEQVFINFPDPWPKLRHAKHRLVRKSFLEDLRRVVLRGGKLTLVTDDQVYREEMKQEIGACSFWKKEFEVTEWPDYGGSWFFDFWTGKGRTIYYQHYVSD